MSAGHSQVVAGIGGTVVLVGDLHRDPDPLTSLHGRRRECAALMGCWLGYAVGAAPCWFCAGGGIGKTSLLGYLTELATGFRVARCMGVESEMVSARTTAAAEDPLAGLPDLRLPGLDEQSARALLHR
jgi:hypothetical protein